MEKLAENVLTYFYLRHVVIVVTAFTTISLTPVKKDEIQKTNDNISKSLYFRLSTVLIYQCQYTGMCHLPVYINYLFIEINKKVTINKETVK
jgi:hypothetical protein